MMDMDVVILAAGMGTRFGASLPKCLVEFDGKSLLLRQLDAILEACPGLPLGCVHVVSGYKHSHVAEHLERAGAGDTHLVYNPFYGCAGILGSAWLSLPHIRSRNVFRTDADLLFTDVGALRELLSLRETALCGGECYRRRETPVMSVEGERVRSISLEADYVGPGEWLCAEWYTDGDYGKVVSGAAELVLCGHYFKALNRAIAAAEIGPPLAFGLRGTYEMDTREDMEHVGRLLQGG